ncbi:hypothetical protein LCGC14_2699720, partial [marine sediment metagenome]
THLRNLAQLASSEWLWSDAKRIELELDCRVVGMSTIKRRRLEEIGVKCHPGTKVGQYAPFYFCPRSIMLYMLYRGNHPDIEYEEGQRPIVHLQADLRSTIQWADDNGVKWAFSDRNAGGYLADFFNRWDDLDKINWAAVAATDFQDILVKEGKQAEFLVCDAFPWALVEKIGVIDQQIDTQVRASLANSSHQPSIHVERGWYY